MNSSPRNQLIIAFLAVFCGLVVVILFMRRPAPEPVPVPLPPAATVAPAPKVPPPAVRVETPLAAASAKPASAAPAPEWQPQPEAQFDAEDVKQAGRGASLDLGNYSVRAGEVFDVKLVLDGPPLESMTLILNYDTQYLEAVPDSGKPVGKVFRQGIEYYVDNKKGRLALIHAGMPGMKNMNAAAREVIARFQMRAKAPGKVTLTPGMGDKGIDFTNGKMQEERFSITGGGVEIR